MKSIGSNPRMFKVGIELAIGALFISVAFMLAGQTRARLESNPGDSDHYLTHVSTAKPIYRAGEKVYVRAVLLHAIGPSAMTSPGRTSFEIKGPKGEAVTSGIAAIVDSVAGFSWDIPANQPGGEYTVRISQPLSLSAERKFDVRA